MKFLSAVFIVVAFMLANSAHAQVVNNGYQGNLLTQVKALIGSGSTATAAIPTKGYSLVGIIMPATFTGTAISFQSGTTATGTFVPVTTGTLGMTLSYTVAASKHVAIDPKDFFGITFLKLISNGTEGAARTLNLSLKGI